MPVSTHQPTTVRDRVRRWGEGAFPAQASLAHKWELVATAALAMFAAYRGVVDFAQWGIHDYFVYHQASLDVRHSLSAYTSHAPLLPYTYPPPLSLLLMPLTYLPHALLTPLILAASITVCVLLMRKLFAGYGWLIVVIAMCTPPMLRSLYLGQINPLLFTLLLADHLWLPARWRGYASGVAAGLKVTPAFMGLAFLLRRDWAAVGKMALGFTATTGVTWLILPGDSWHYWSQLLWDTSRVGDLFYPDNASLTGALWRFNGDQKPPAPASWGVAALSLAVIGLAVVAGLRRWHPAPNGQRDVLGLTTAVGLAALLLSPISWTHHGIWVLALVVVLLREKLYWAGVLALVATLPEPLLLDGPTQTVAPLTWAHGLLTSLMTGVALAGLVYLALRPPRGLPGPTPPPALAAHAASTVGAAPPLGPPEHARRQQ